MVILKAALVESKIEKSELAKYSRNAHSALALDIANCIASQDLGKSWLELACKDNVGVKMVSEDKQIRTKGRKKPTERQLMLTLSA